MNFVFPFSFSHYFEKRIWISFLVFLSLWKTVLNFVCHFCTIIWSPGHPLGKCLSCRHFQDTTNYYNACTLVPTVFRWHGKREFKCHFRFSFSHDIEKQIWVLLFVFHFRPNFEKRFCTSYFVFRFRITLKNGYQFQFSFFVFAARSDKNVCKITTRRENGNAYHRVTALLIPRSGRQRPGFLAYPPPSGE